MTVRHMLIAQTFFSMALGQAVVYAAIAFIAFDPLWILIAGEWRSFLRFLVLLAFAAPGFLIGGIIWAYLFEWWR